MTSQKDRKTFHWPESRVRAQRYFIQFRLTHVDPIGIGNSLNMGSDR